MAHVAGIRFEKDNQGVKRYIRIDLKKYGKEIEPFLQKLNIESDEQFEHDWEQSLTPDQFKSQMHLRIKKWFDSTNFNLLHERINEISTNQKRSYSHECN